MKRIIAFLLCLTLLLTGCGLKNADPALQEDNTTPQQQWGEVPEFTGLDDPEILSYIEDTVGAEMMANLDHETYYIQEISAKYVSKEYLEELEYNSQSNIFFGYTLDELDALFQGERYVFTVDDSGQTVVQELVEIEDKTYDKVIKNVAIGAGVILVCVVVAVVTKNPAAAAGAGKTVKMIFTASSMGAKAGSIMALKSAGIGGTAATVVEAIKTKDWERAMKAGLLGASEGFKAGAIIGTVQGVATGIKVVGNSRFFPDGSLQATKYPNGVEYTKASNGQVYPRFEKWAKATAKFDAPTYEAAIDHTGLSGNYYWDAKLANQQCGFTQTPDGYVWHHVEDMKTMILVPQDLHSPAKGGLPHYGGASLIREFLGLTV